MMAAVALMLASCGTQKVLNVTSVYDVKKVVTTVHNADTLVYNYRKLFDDYTVRKRMTEKYVTSTITDIGYAEGYDNVVKLVVTLDNDERFYFDLLNANRFVVGRKYSYWKDDVVLDTIYRYEKTVFRGSDTVEHKVVDLLYSDGTTYHYTVEKKYEYDTNVVVANQYYTSSEFVSSDGRKSWHVCDVSLFEGSRKGELYDTSRFDFTYNKFKDDIELYGECTFTKYYDVDVISYDTVFYRSNVKCVSKRRLANGTYQFLVHSSSDCNMYWVNVDKDTYDSYEEPRDPNFLMSCRTDRLGFCDYLPLSIVDRLQGTDKVRIERVNQYGLFQRR